jgi:hypothetical protein
MGPTVERCVYVQNSGYMGFLTPDDKQCCVGTEIYGRTHGFVSVKQERAILRLFQLVGTMRDHATKG